jgi:AcrR family transcriptional regulator
MSNSPPYDERLDQLLATSAEVFAQQGYHGTSMRDLSRATGMSLAGMYYYVRGKDDLLFRIQERCFTGFLEGARTAVLENTDPAYRIRRLVHHHVTFFAANMSQMKVLAHESDSLTKEGQAAIDQLKREYTALLTGLVGEVRNTEPGPDEKVAAYALFGMMNWVYTWYQPNGSVSPEQLADRFADLFLHGLRNSLPAAVSAEQ